MELLLKFGPILMQLLGDPTIRDMLAHLGTQNFPGVDPNKALTAGTSLFDSNTTKWVQAALGALGYTGLTVDGVQGASTKSAVKAFQTDNDLVSDGWAGEITQNKLREKIVVLAALGVKK